MQINQNDQLWLMDEALIEASKAYREDEVPVGAIIVDHQQNILARAHNQKEKKHNPCGHAEILAIVEAGKKINNWRLAECSLVVTLEPCLMCLGAISQARLGHIYFGAYDAKGGGLSLGYEVFNDRRLNHQFGVTGGIRHYECSKILSQFFREKRAKYTQQSSH